MASGADGRLEWASVADVPGGVLRMVVEAAPNAVLLIDTNGRIVLVNASTEKLFGYWREDLLGRPVEMLIPERYRGRHPEYRAGFLDLPGNRPMGRGRDLYALRSDGTEIPVEIGLKPLDTPVGRFVLASVVDISEHKRAEERLRAIVEAAPTAVLLVTSSGRIALLNSQAETLFGYARGELLGRPLEVLVPERFRASHVGLRDMFMRAPQSRPMGAGRDLFGLRRDGSEVPIEIGLSPLETPEGRSVLAAIVDITERKRAEGALAHTLATLSARNHELQSFAAAASHDLQEPLRKIVLFGELLETRMAVSGNEEMRDYLNRMRGAAQRMDQLVTALLGYARVATHAAAFEAVDLNVVVGEVLDDLGARIGSNGAEVTVADLPALEGDRTQLRQLFQNLIGNALKFVVPGRPARVVVDARPIELRGEPAWAIRVQDNGIGFTAADRERIFKPFLRLHHRSDYEGSGIGLAIVQRIVERHHGRIEAEGELSVGACFTVYLPQHFRGEDGEENAVPDHPEAGVEPR